MRGEVVCLRMDRGFRWVCPTGSIYSFVILSFTVTALLHVSLCFPRVGEDPVKASQELNFPLTAQFTMHHTEVVRDATIQS